jgi:hypothetical protein
MVAETQLGTHVVLLARSVETLEKSKDAVRTARKNSSQIVDILCVDLCDPKAVSAIDLLRLSKLHIQFTPDISAAVISECPIYWNFPVAPLKFICVYQNLYVYRHTG